MRASALKYTVLSWITGITMLIIFLMPFHAFLTVWLASAIHHYTALRLWKEFLLAIITVGSLLLIILDKKIRFHTLSRRLVQIILAYIVLNVVWGLIALNSDDVTSKALGYGLIVNLRYLVFFLVAWAVTLRISRLRRHWQWLLLWPATIVIIFGLLEVFVFPNGFLKHFGYGPSTINPVETINSNLGYVRAMSTLRGANPLGAYLTIPISLLAVLMLRSGHRWRQGVLMLGGLALLFFTYSRSAWIGTMLAIAAVVFAAKLPKRYQKLAVYVSIGVVVVILGLGIAFKNSTKFENFVFHTQHHSAVQTTSDQFHLSAIKSGLKDLSKHPLGSGPGTAGPASIYNGSHPARLAENYYIQIGQEVGWLGLALFILINVGVGYLLWLRRDDPLALSLFASLIGITFVNMLSHAWADDTLSYIWWGLAGLAMTPDRSKTPDSPDNTES
jgi:hypothetical protein